MSGTLTIDVHTHYLAGALVQALESRSEFPRIVDTGDHREIQYGAGSGHELYSSMTDIEAQLARMEQAGIDLAVLSTNVPGVDWFSPADGIAVAAAVNDELADLCRSRPERLAAMAVIPAQAPGAAAGELRRSASRGLKGAILYSNAAGALLDEDRFEPVYEAAAEVGRPLMIHPTHPLSAAAVDAYALVPTIGFLVDTSTAVMRLILGGVFDRHPALKLYLPHAGSLLPQLAGRIDVEAGRMPGGMGGLSEPPSEQIRKLYTDSVCAWPPALRSCLELFGPEQVMFGTDYPFWEPEASVRTLQAAELDPAAESSVRSGTAERFFGLHSGM